MRKFTNVTNVNIYIAVRIPKRLKEEIEEIAKIEKLDRANALRKVLEIGIK